MRTSRYASHLRKSLVAAGLFSVPVVVLGQPTVNGNCDAAEYGNHDYVSGGVTYRMTWTSTDLYVCATVSNTNNPLVVYFDIDPSSPVNGGTGTTTGFNYDGVTPFLPFSSDAVIFVKAGYRESRRESGGAFSSPAPGFGGYSNSQGSHEVRVPWSNLTGGGAPSAFNFFSYHNNENTNTTFAPIPVENPSGSSQSSPQMVRYFTVSLTGTSPSQSPFANNSYTHIGSNLSFGGVSVYDLTMNTSGATITRTAGNWTVARNLVVGNGALDLSTGTTTVQTLNLSGGTLNFGTGATSAQNLVVSNGTATLEAGDGVVTLTGDLNASAGTFAVAQADRLVLASSVGSVATVSSDAGISGDYTSQRTFTATNGWRTVGVPFDNQTVASLNGEVHLQGFSDLRPGPTNVMLYSYNPANATNVGNGSEAFVPVPATTSALTAGDGYLMYVFATRNPSTGVAEAAATRTWAVAGRETGSATLTKTLPNSDPAIPSSAFHLVANPYAGDLDWDAILAASTNLSTTYQVVNPANGQFVSYTQGSGTYAGRYIAPYTGFFVESDADATPTSITFAKSQKSNANVPAIVGKNAAVVALFDVSVRGAELASSPVRLAFANDARTDADRWDARLLPALTQQYAQMALVSGARSLIVEGRAFPSGSESYTLRFATTRAGRYTIEASDFNNVPDAWSIRLSDRATGQTVDLRSTPYTFDTDVAASERFSLVVSPTATSAERPVATTLVVSPVFPNPARTGAQLSLTSPVAGTAHVDLLDVLGRRVARRAVDGLVPGAERTLTVDVAHLPAGSYVVRIATPDGQTATRRLTVVR